MPIDYEKLKNWKFADLTHSYGKRDTILYALALGYGDDPLNEDDLRLVYEKNLLTLPSMSVVLGYPGFWLKEQPTGVDWKKVLHGEQGFVIHRPLPVEGEVVGRTRVVDIIDKGAGKGALLYSERDVFDASTGDLLCTLTSTSFLRGDGGFGGPAGPIPPQPALPERAPDAHFDVATLPQSALIYRLCGDYNPLHADPLVAREAGFDRPILHGLCSFGIAVRSLVRLFCPGDPNCLKSVSLRFSSPVYPGETIRTEVWREGGAVCFRARVLERNVVALTNGLARFDGTSAQPERLPAGMASPVPG